MPVMELNESMYLTNVPVAIATCGLARMTSTTFSLMVSETLNPEPSGGRMMISAPVPRDRDAKSSSTPRLSPTRVRIIVTSTPIATILNKVRTGRCFRFSKTRRWINDLSYQPRLRYNRQCGDHCCFGAQNQRPHGGGDPSGSGKRSPFVLGPTALRAGQNGDGIVHRA